MNWQDKLPERDYIYNSLELGRPGAGPDPQKLLHLGTQYGGHWKKHWAAGAWSLRNGSTCHSGVCDLGKSLPLPESQPQESHLYTEGKLIYFPEGL